MREKEGGRHMREAGSNYWLGCARMHLPRCSPGFFIQSSSWDTVTNQTSSLAVAYSRNRIAALVLSCTVGVLCGGAFG